MVRRLLTLVLIWATLKSLSWAFFFYGPHLLNQYSDRTGAVFAPHAIQILKRDLGYPRELYIPMEQANLNDQQKAYLDTLSRQTGADQESLYRIGDLELTILDSPTPERSYNGKIMCQVFFAYQFNENSDFIRMKDLGIIKEYPLILKNMSQFNQVTLEKGSVEWQVQDKENLLLSVPGNPTKNQLKKLAMFIIPLTPW